MPRRAARQVPAFVTRDADRMRRSRSNIMPNLPLQENERAIQTFKAKFVPDLCKFNLIVCPKCSRQELKDEIESATYLCNSCRSSKTSQMFRATISMDPGEVPPELQGLTDIEEMLIARVHPILRVYQLRAGNGAGQYRYTCHVLNVEQEMQPLARILPQRFADIIFESHGQVIEGRSELLRNAGDVEPFVVGDTLDIFANYIENGNAKLLKWYGRDRGANNSNMKKHYPDIYFGKLTNDKIKEQTLNVFIACERCHSYVVYFNSYEELQVFDLLTAEWSGVNLGQNGQAPEFANIIKKVLKSQYVTWRAD